MDLKDNKVEEKTFSELLNEFKKLKGLTQEDIANQLNLSRVTVAYWCNGSTVPPLSTYRKLCILLGQPIQGQLTTAWHKAKQKKKIK